MGDLHNSNRDRSASSGAGATGDARQTVLLSDLPEQDRTQLAPTPNLGSKFSNLSEQAHAALGVRYDILADAGSGSMGNVYKACDRETGGIVALKLLKPEIASDQQMMDRFKRELLFARKITHKNVCRVYEFNRVNGVAYTSMEFVEGESLRATLNRFGKLVPQRATAIGLQICSGLKEAHAQGIVHRDLKPENVMLDTAGNVKIMDFGIARSMDSGTRLTGSLAGTPAYMAPEQVSGKPVDYRTDIYSVGLVLYEMFTGVPTFKAENSVAVALKQMSEEVGPPHTIEPTIPVSIERAILKCLEKEPERRYLSIAELEAALAAPHTLRTVFASAATAAGSAQPNARPVTAPTAVLRAQAHPVVTQKRSASPVVWILVGAAIACATFGALRAVALQKSAKGFVFAEKVHAPVPPEFAYEIPKPALTEPDVAAPEATAALTDSTNADASSHVAAKPIAESKPIVAEKKPVAPPEVFPRMEVGPIHRPAHAPAAVAAVPNEYLWAGRYSSLAKAHEKQKIVERMLVPSSVIKNHSGKSDAYDLWLGPVKISRSPFLIKNLESKGFSNVKEVPPTTYAKAVSK